MKKCIVSFKDLEGLRHAVEVDAESLYEAAALAARTFSDHGCKPAPATELAIEVTAPSVTHSVTLKKVAEWTGSTAKSPKDFIQRERVKELLAGLAKS